jgi:Polyketide cyclase / dehydrase and lipid transport
MIGVERTTSATPAQVWSALSNGWLYASWVVGASRIRDVDRHWPEVGSKIHHSIGLWPALLDDVTESLESSAGLLVLSAHAWPVGTARVRVHVEKEGAGSRLTMDETAESAPARWIPNNAQRLLLAPRLNECLYRLALLAENGASSRASRPISAK